MRVDLYVTFAVVVSLVNLFLATAEIGVDLSVATEPATWQCLVSDYNVSFSIIRAYRNKGAVDTNSANSLINARTAGVSDLGAYIFPCVTSSAYATSNNITCDSPMMQVVNTVRYLADNQIGFNRGKSAIPLTRMWIDIEDEVPAKYYDADPKVNQGLISEMVETLEKLRIPVGLYTTKTYWQNIMGNIEGYGAYPLWYPRYDGVNTLEFFAPFADFQSVQIKQTGGDSGWCGISQVDPDYRP